MHRTSIPALRSFRNHHDTHRAVRAVRPPVARPRYPYLSSPLFRTNRLLAGRAISLYDQSHFTLFFRRSTYTDIEIIRPKSNIFSIPITLHPSSTLVQNSAATESQRVLVALTILQQLLPRTLCCCRCTSRCSLLQSRELSAG